MRYPVDFQFSVHKRYGKWLLFANKGEELTALWARLMLGRVVYVIQGVLGFSSPNSHLAPPSVEIPSDVNPHIQRGLISVFCELGVDSDAICVQGTQLVDLIGYTSAYGTLVFESCTCPSQKIATIRVPLAPKLTSTTVSSNQPKIPAATTSIAVVHKPDAQQHQGCLLSPHDNNYQLPGICDPSPIYTLFSLNVCFTATFVTE